MCPCEYQSSAPAVFSSIRQSRLERSREPYQIEDSQAVKHGRSDRLFDLMRQRGGEFSHRSHSIDVCEVRLGLMYRKNKNQFQGVTSGSSENLGFVW